MDQRGLLRKHGIVRDSIIEDILQFAIPGVIVFAIELWFCARARLSGFWETLWGLVRHPETLPSVPLHVVLGISLFFFGLTIMIIGQVTLWRNYSSTVVIKKDHQLVTRGIYRYTRNPIYLGGIIGVMSLPLYAASLYGFLASVVLIPLVLNRIRLEERLLSEEFGEAYQVYRDATKKLIPFVY